MALRHALVWPVSVLMYTLPAHAAVRLEPAPNGGASAGPVTITCV